MRVLVIDNYDSFVYNLVQYLAQLGADCVVWRNDAAELTSLTRPPSPATTTSLTRPPSPATTASPDALDGFDGVLVSPGPSTPERAGASIEVIKRCAERRLPVLGVCLGHQAIGVAWGATVDRAPELRHGKVSRVHHGGAGVLRGLPDPFTATRYHSLTILPETIPTDEFEVTGHTEDGVVMAMRHRELPVQGVQFHPESVLTEGGHRMLANWLAECGHPVDEQRIVELESAMRALAEAAAHS